MVKVIQWKAQTLLRSCQTSNTGHEIYKDLSHNA